MRKTQLAIPFFALILLIPPGVLAQQTNEMGTDDIIDNPHILSPDDTIGPVGIVNELREAHNKISTIMHQHADDYYAVADDLVFSMTYVDEENQELVVAFDPVMLTLGLYPDAGDVEDLLDSELPVRVEFAKFYPESHIKISQGTINAWINLYNSRCDSPTASSLCKALASNFTKVHYTLDSNNKWQPPSGTTTTTPSTPKPTTPTTPKPTTPTTSTSSKLSGVFTDDFESGLGKWRESGEPDWRADTFDERDIPPGVSSPNKVAEADNCDTGCTLTVARSINISSLSSPVLEFWRYVDSSLDKKEYLKLEVTKNGRTWVTLDTWSQENGQDTDDWEKESYDLKPYKSSSFKLRFVALMSSPSEDVGIDNVVVKNDTDKDRDGIHDPQDRCPTVKGVYALNGCPDRTAPVIKVPPNKTYETGGRSITVNFSVTATDNVDKMVIVKCSHPSGLFLIGNTVVTCTATDKAGNKATKSFKITVIKIIDNAPPVITAPASLTYEAPDDTGRIVTYTAIAGDRVDGKVGVNCNPSSGSKFPVGTTIVTCTATDKAGNKATATITVTLTYTAPISCEKGFELVDDVCQEIEDESETSNLVQGGERHLYMYYFYDANNNKGNGSRYGTLTLPTQNENGTGVVVSAHVALHWNIQNNTSVTPTSAESFVYRNNNPHKFSDSIAIGPLLQNNVSSSIDAAFIPSNSSLLQNHTISIGNGTSIFVEHGLLKEINPGTQPIYLFGQFTDSVGNVLYKNATVNVNAHYNRVYTLFNHGIGNYTSVGGDSGSPIVSYNNDTAYIVGMHSGTACRFSSPVENLTDINLRPDCPANRDISIYKVFTPWENVMHELQLR